jgi:hypothetical protein
LPRPGLGDVLAELADAPAPLPMPPQPASTAAAIPTTKKWLALTTEELLRAAPFGWAATVKNL